MKAKRILAAIMAIAMVLSFAACSKSDSSNKAAVSEDGSIILKNDDSVELGTPETTLTASDVYAKLEYTPQMFYGEYQLADSQDFGSSDDSDAKTKYITDYSSMTSPTDSEQKITVLPYNFEAGSNTFNNVASNDKSNNWLRAYFLTTDGYLIDLACTYEISGTKLVLTPAKSVDYDEDKNKLTYELADTSLEYDFSFSGRELTLSYDGKSITLTAGLDTECKDYIYADNYLSDESKRIDTIDHISYRYAEDDNSIYFDEVNTTSSVQNAVGKLSKDGLFTFTVPFESGTKTYQYVYFLCGNDGIILTDGTNTYYYNDSYRQHNESSIYDNMDSEQTDALKDMSDADVEKIAKKKDDLLTDLTAAFMNAGITVNVDKETGEIAMDSTVLFGGDSATVTDDGKAFLNKFLKAYTDIIYNEKYDGFISKTMIEGHIAPVDGTTYEGGLPLSKKRAENVKKYCLSDESGVDTSKLADTLETVGYSQSKPVYDSDGNVDYDASRRVSFRFIVNIENAE